MTPAQPDEVYPRAPVVEAVFEIRFPGEPKVECRRDTFFEAVRSEFPSVYVPALQPGSFPALSPYHFRAADGSSQIMVALNRLSFSTRAYKGYLPFRAKVLELFERFGKEFAIDHLTRAGLRFINIVPFTREEGLIPLERFFQFGITLPVGLEYRPTNLSLVFTTELDGGQLTTKLEAVQDETKMMEALVLDFDYAKVKDLKFSAVDSYLEESHTHTKKFFEGLITPGFREWMRGEGVE